MTKVIKGTKDAAKKDVAYKKAKDFRVVKGPKDVRQVRCPGCKELASQVPDGKGGNIYQCTCGRRFAFKPM